VCQLHQEPACRTQTGLTPGRVAWPDTSVTSRPQRHMTHVARVACPFGERCDHVTHVSLAGLTRSLMHSVTYAFPHAFCHLFVQRTHGDTQLAKHTHYD